MIALEFMTAQHFTPWLDLSIKQYAEGRSQAGNVRAEKAMEESSRDFNRLLPEGLHTENNYFYNAVEQDDQQIVGTLWVSIRHEQQDVYIYGIRIDESYRGKGFGRQTLQALEALIDEKAWPPKITLHVFADNDVALNLYRSSGFEETNIIMSKRLAKETPVYD